ncbi:MAG: tripartite tricarboxylate transporter substrate binding protein [Pseudolabrys sp.]|nr:tripartite tricarboxylate transporter substrate binding protein [Pseudolabrys sp.]
MQKIVTCLIAGIAVAGLAVTTSRADDYPTKPVTFIVPFPPGGLVDFTARPVAAALERVWKQPAVIANRPGAGGGVGIVAAGTARPDGYTLLFAHPSITSVPASDVVLGRKPSFDREQYVPIARFVADPLILVVKGDSPFKTFKDVVDAARKEPGSVSYSSSGAYGAVHLPFEMAAHAAGVKFKHVAYTGGGPALTAVLGNHVQMTMGSPSVLAPQIKSGAIRPLLNTGAKRVALLPDVPTVYDLGYKDAEFYLWVGLFGSAKIPAETIAKVRDGVAKAVKDPEFIQQLQKMQLPVEYQDGPDFDKFWKADAERIEAAIKRIGKVE